MTTGHLVARLYATFNGKVDFDDLKHARRKIIATLQLIFLRLKALFEQLVLLFQQSLRRCQLVIEFGVRELQLEPLITVETRENVGINFCAFRETATRNCGLPAKQLSQTGVSRLLINSELFFEILAVVRQLRRFDLLGTSILLKTVTREHLHINNRAFVA